MNEKTETKPADQPEGDLPADDQPETEQSDVEAFAAGVAEASDADQEADAAEVEQVDGKEVEAKVDEDKPADDKPEAKPDPVVDEEIKALGLKERAADRFRDLTAKVAEIEPLRAQAERAKQWEEAIAETQATPEQFGSAMTYLRAINSGDESQMRQAHEVMTKELEWLGKQLGVEVGGYDPLIDHSDLQEMIESGDMTRKAALEVVSARAAKQRNEQTQQRTQQQTQAQQAEAKAASDVQALNDRLKASDPHFAVKLQQLAPMLKVLKKSLPADRLAAAVEEAYMALPDPQPRPAPTPLRPVSSSTGQLPEPNSGGR